MPGDAAWRLLCFSGLFGDVAAVAPWVEADRGLILSHLPQLSKENHGHNSSPKRITQGAGSRGCCVCPQHQPCATTAFPTVELMEKGAKT